MSWQTLRAFFLAVLLAGLNSCSGCSSETAANSSSSSGGTSRLTLGGTVQIPTQVAASLSAPGLTRALSRPDSQALTLRFITDDEAAAPDTTVELLDAEGTVLATTTTADDGTYSFEDVDTSTLADPNNENFVTCYIRTTTGDGEDAVVEMSVVSESDTAIEAAIAAEEAGEDSAFASLDVDPQSTAETLLDFQGTGIDPLTAETIDTSDVNLPMLDAINEAAMDGAVEALADATTVDDLSGNTIDEALAALLVATYELTGDQAGDLSAAETLNVLFNMESGDADSAAVATALQSQEGFENFDAADLQEAFDSVESFQTIAEDVWASSDTFESLLADNDGAISLFVGASIAGTTTTELDIMNASDDLLSTQLQLFDSLDFDALETSDLGDVLNALSGVLDPELILAMAENPDGLTVLEGVMDSMFSGDNVLDPQVAEVLFEALTDQANDEGFWDDFLSGGSDIDDSLLSNFIGFFDAAVESGQFDDFFSGEAIFEWGDILDATDFTQDFSALDSSAFDDLMGEVFDQTMVTIDPDSCQYFCGGLTPNGLGCDDGCIDRNDCASDKNDQCGESYLLNLLSQYGFDFSTSAFDFFDTAGDDDGDSIANTDDNCIVAYNPDQADSDSDGFGDACQDTDNDGWIDIYDNCLEASNPDQSDTNWDGAGDACDTDDDGDGLSDEDDNCILVYNPSQDDSDSDGKGDQCDGTDSDGDGWINLYDNCDTIDNSDQLDSDWDSAGDACDEDDDGDGAEDSTDNCPVVYNIDQADSDSDGEGDSCDGEDTDNDGWIDVYDNCDELVNPDQIDSDYDGEGDSCDADDDNDGVDDFDSAGLPLDNCQVTPNTAQDDSDSNGLGDSCDGTDTDLDGWIDIYDNCDSEANPDQVDSEYDGRGDACDDDDDNDSVNDDEDNCPAVPNALQDDSDSNGAGDACDGTDSDLDGWIDIYDNCDNTANSDQLDSDSDTEGDACDADDDADTVEDESDNCPSVSNSSQIDSDDNGVGDSCDGTDTDLDGWIDIYDNCDSVANPDQSNIDSDSQGDACDDDDDGDGVADDTDNCPFTSNVGQADGDSNGLGDACDGTDTDLDGVIDSVDNCDSVSNTSQSDTDSDGTGDICDSDQDGDGIDNGHDVCPETYDDQTDTDSDGIGNACTDDNDGDAVADGSDVCPNVSDDQTDTDSDGSGDACDSDDDGDSVDDDHDADSLDPAVQ